MIHIVFQNQHFVICDKPHGVLSTPSRFEDEDERACLGTSLQKELGLQIYPINRLDYEVSGLVLYAKTPEAHRQGNLWFENKKVTKTYRAWTSAQSYAHIPDNVKNSRQPMDPHPGQTYQWRTRMLRGKRRAYESPQGKESLTMASFLGAKEKHLIWDLNPVTGRPHQLRFDLSRHGFAILGDKLYGSGVDYGENRIALRSYKIDFKSATGANALGLPDALEIDSL